LTWATFWAFDSQTHLVTLILADKYSESLKFERRKKIFSDAEKGCQIFKAKIPFWVNFGGSCNGKCWYILWPVGLFYGHMDYFRAIWFILLPFGLFYCHLVYFVAIWYILWLFF
jgi:hypothetical protein